MILFSLNFAVMAPFMFHFAVSQRASISLNKTLVAEGESVIVTCHTEILDQEISPVTVLLKHVFNSDIIKTSDTFPQILSRNNLRDMTSLEIATNHFLNEDIFDSKRYRSSYHLVTPGDYSRIEYKLTIDHASTEDFGYYSCRMSVGNQTVESQVELLQIVTPVTGVKWSEYNPSSDTWHPLSPNETLRAGENEFVMIRCESEGGFPKPSYSVFVDGTAKSDEHVDITSLFKENTSCLLGKGPRGLQKLLLNSTLTPVDLIENNEIGIENPIGLRILFSYHEKNIVCSADVAEYTDEKLRMKKAEIFIELSEFRPKFECKTKILAEANAQNFSITCLIKARPGIKRMKIFHNGSMTIEHKNGEYAAESEVINGTNEEHVRATLIIFRVSWKHFGKYEFVAINDIGNSTHIVELQKDNENQKTLSQKSFSNFSSLHVEHVGLVVILSLIMSYLNNIK